ncbi:hypothetical protein HDV62DRAFT_384347 [Trichoderma sp. SZMC 28011]
MERNLKSRSNDLPLHIISLPVTTMACWGWRGCAGSASCALANPCLIWQVAESTGRRTRDVCADMGIVKTRYTVDDSACSYSHRSWRWIKKMKQTRETKRQNCHLQRLTIPKVDSYLRQVLMI